MKIYHFEFTVSPKRATTIGFPIDMLRYDHCWPKSEEDSMKIANSFNIMNETGVEVVILRSNNENKSWTPTSGRWESFGWKVIDYKRIDY